MQSVHSAGFLAEYHAGCKIITYPRASTVARSLTIDRNFARISSSQESARINAFYYVVASRPQNPDRGFHAVCIRKINISIRILQYLCCKTPAEARSHDHASVSFRGLLSAGNEAGCAWGKLGERGSDGVELLSMEVVDFARGLGVLLCGDDEQTPGRTLFE